MQKQKQNIKLDIRTNKLIQKKSDSISIDFFSALAMDFFIYKYRSPCLIGIETIFTSNFNVYCKLLSFHKTWASQIISDY